MIYKTAISAQFFLECGIHHRHAAALSIHGHEKVGETMRLGRMNLAIHGLEGDIREAITYYDDPHDASGRFHFVLVTLRPFKVTAVDTAMRLSARRDSEGKPQDLPERQDHEQLKDSVGPGRHFPCGLPRTDNANYLGIQLFYSALKDGKAGTSGSRAGFVIANSASTPAPPNRKSGAATVLATASAHL